MNYVFYGFDIRSPNKKKEVIVSALSLSDAKLTISKNFPFFISTCVYPELNK